MKIYISGILLILCSTLLAQAPVVENVRFEQRTDGSLLVDIYYDVSDADDDSLYIVIKASDNDGATWALPCKSLVGDVGLDIPPGVNKHVVWDFYADNPDTSGDKYRVQVIAYDNICGLTITNDLTLTRDLKCPWGTGRPAIEIGASNITLDLGGHTIYGDWSSGTHEAIIAGNVDGITIKNGTIDGFTYSIILGNSDNSKVENITIKNLENNNADIFVSGIVVTQCQNVTVRDCQFEYLYAHHKQAISMGNSNITVDNIELNGGSVGVDFGGDHDLAPSSGTVMNSRFVHNTIDGILVHYCENVRIANNVFERSSITVNPAFVGTTKRLIIEGNNVHDQDGGTGIRLLGLIESTISNNTVTNNLTGIALEPSKGCNVEPNWDCFYATNNVIKDNVVLGNNLDLYHHELCTGNTWIGNTFETAEGAEIYTAPPATAREFLSSVDSAAKVIALDAQLLQVSSGNCDTLGNSMKWVYIYKSASQQSQYEFWYHNGKVIRRNSLTDPPNEGLVPITGSWIDSDSAIVITDSLGGKEFRESFSLEHIEMGVEEFGWTVFYFAQDTTFRAEFNAK